MHIPVSSPHMSKRAKHAALFAALASTFITTATLIVFFFTHSYVIGLAALESSIDMMVSFTNTKIVTFARTDADERHPYGHGRAESIASLGQAALMAGGALVMLFLSITHLMRLYKSDDFLAKMNTTPWLVLFFSIFAGISYSVSWWLKKQGKVLNSPALLSDSGHYFVDFLSNVSTTCALALIVFLKYEFLDPMIAIIFSGVILRVAYRIFHTNVNDLMDSDVPPEVKEEAYEVIMKIDSRIIDIHRFRGRKSGHRYFFDFHITLPHTLSFNEVHDIIETVEEKLSVHYDGDVSVHPDPSNIRKAEQPEYLPRSKR